jgi:hypothetical protein
METYHIIRANGGWGISQNQGKTEGSYSTREGAFEAVYLAASNDIKKGAGITITVDPPAPGESAIGGKP